jgi:hypothetical protein
MVGRATFTDEIVKGPIKDVRVATINAEFSRDLLSDNVGRLHGQYLILGSRVNHCGISNEHLLKCGRSRLIRMLHSTRMIVLGTLVAK